MTKQPLCWVVTDGRASMDNQCLALAEALGCRPFVKHVVLREPWRTLTPYLRMGMRWATVEHGEKAGDAIKPPWPDVLIASGRQCVAPALHVRRASRGTCYTVYIEDPQIRPTLFDRVIVPEHDRLRGPNVITILGALNRVTPERLAASAAATPSERFGSLKGPKVAVLVGGNSRVYRLGATQMRELADQLHALALGGASLMVTTSRRTGRDNEQILRERLGDTDAYVWDGQGGNPYLSMLGYADTVLVTCDSVAMISEACGSGKPVYLIALEGGSEKFRTYHKAVYKRGMCRPFAGKLEQWSYTPLAEAARVAEEIRPSLLQRGCAMNPPTLRGTVVRRLSENSSRSEVKPF